MACCITCIDILFTLLVVSIIVDVKKEILSLFAQIVSCCKILLLMVL
jgi:hypothetical protein